MAKAEFSLQPLMFWTITEINPRNSCRCKWLDFRVSRLFDKKEALEKYNSLEKHKFIFEEGSLECGYYKSVEDDLQEGGIFNFLTGLRFAGSIRNDNSNVKTLYYTSDENLKQLEGSIANW